MNVPAWAENAVIVADTGSSVRYHAKCPYCGKEMRLGQICADNLLSWTPDGERVSGATRWSKSPNSIVLAKYYLLAPASVDAFYCEDCKKIVIDVGNV